MSSENLKELEMMLRAWEKIQEKQIHFDDMIMQTRAISLGVVTISFATIFYLIRTSPELISSRSAIVLISVPVAFWIAAFILDQCYYYKLLICAVESGDLMQNKLQKAGLDIDDVNERLKNGVRHPRIPICSYYIVPMLVVFVVFFLVAELADPTLPAVPAVPELNSTADG